MEYPAEVFGIVSALYWKHIDLAYGADHDRAYLAQIIAEQITKELGSGWSSDGVLLIHTNATEFFTLRWLDGDNQILYPMERVDQERATIVPEPARAVDHLEPAQPDFTNPEAADQTRIETGLLMVIKQVGTMYAMIDSMRNEIEQLKKIKYRAQLNFKQVTFSPVMDDKK